MLSRNLGGSLGIVAVGVILGIIGFAAGLNFLLIPALIITVIGGGIPFYQSLQTK